MSDRPADGWKLWMAVFVFWAAAAAFGIASAPALAVSFEWATVGSPGNPPDDQVMQCCGPDGSSRNPTSGYGSVAYVYQIAKHEVTWEQYAEFLNAVAASDPNGLFHINMEVGRHGGIVRSGTEGSYTYTVKPGFERFPVGFIDFFRVLRFANWLQNGQPSGPQDETTTEDGTYTLLGQRPRPVYRNPGSGYFVASEEEWYKSAYYHPEVDAYGDFSLGFDDPPRAESPPGGATSANYCPVGNQVLGCISVPGPGGPGLPTEVGAYVDATSPWGVYDQVGNYLELSDTLFLSEDPDLPLFGWHSIARGAHYERGTVDNSAAGRLHAPMDCDNCWGFTFRVARLPECTNGVDDDHDGLADLDDPGCDSPDDVDEKLSGLPCDDGLDNDGDGGVDFVDGGSGDPGCLSPFWLREDPQCQDGDDNDADGLIDFDGGESIHGPCVGGICPAEVSDPDQDGVADPDPRCVGTPWRDQERKSGCGLGFELVLFLPWLRRARGLRGVKNHGTPAREAAGSDSECSE